MEFDFYALPDEAIELVAAILNAETTPPRRWVPGMWHLPSPHLEPRSGVSAADREDIRRIGCVYVFGGYSIEGPDFIRYEHEGRVVYAVGQGFGGPSVYIRLPTECEFDGHRSISKGYVQVLQSYRLRSGEFVPKSPEIEAEYANIVRFLKRHARRAEVRGRKFWITSELMQREQAGTLRVAWHGLYSD